MVWNIVNLQYNLLNVHNEILIINNLNILNNFLFDNWDKINDPDNPNNLFPSPLSITSLIIILQPE